MQINQHPDEETLMAWKDGELAGGTAVSVEAHVASCATCGAVVGELGVLSERLAAWQVEPAAFPVRGFPARPWWGLRWVAAACVALAVISVPAWRWAANRGSTVGVARLSANILLPGAAQAAGAMSDGAAQVTLTVFVDWQCPACAWAYPTYFQLMREYEDAAPGQIAFVIRDYPLDAKCNPALTTRYHPAACEAAAAVRMAHAQGRAEEMIQFLTAHVTPSLEPEAVRSAAFEILGPFDFDTAYARELDGIHWDISEAVARNVQYTPSFFVNDVPLASNGMGLPTADELRAAIDAELH